MDLEIGNDYTALILETFAYMKAIVQMVEQQQAKVVFIDTFNVFDNIKDQVDVEYKHNHILDKINKYTEPTSGTYVAIHLKDKQNKYRQEFVKYTSMMDNNRNQDVRLST